MKNRSPKMAIFCFFHTFLLILSLSTPSNSLSSPCKPPSFSFPTFSKTLNPDSQLALIGDARLVATDSSIRVTAGSLYSSGRVIYTKPIQTPQTSKPISFSSHFSFSISPGNGDGLAFVILPKSFPSETLDGRWFGLSPGLDPLSTVPNLFAVEFDSSFDREVSDPNGNHVGIDMGSLVSAKISDLSKANLVLNSGEKLNCWIDYIANSKRLEVRLSKSGSIRPFYPLISYKIDLSRMWVEEMYVGITASSGNSTQTTKLYSWSFSSTYSNSFLHSEPVDPKAFGDRKKGYVVRRRSDDLLGILAALIFGAGCGAMAALFVFLMWVLFMNQHSIAPAEYPVHPVDFGYEKINVGEKGVFDSNAKTET